MKTLTILFVAAIMMGVGCSKSEDSENNPDKPDKPSPLPDLPDPNDVCSCMDDIIFMQYCYDNFDVNKDGKVSKIIHQYNICVEDWSITVTILKISSQGDYKL